MHLRKQSTISSSHNPTRHQLSEAESNGTTTCEKPDHILKKKQWMIVSLHRCDDFYILKFYFTAEIMLKTNKQNETSV